MAADDEDYVYDEASGEWISAADAKGLAGVGDAVEEIGRAHVELQSPC